MKKKGLETGLLVGCISVKQARIAKGQSQGGGSGTEGREWIVKNYPENEQVINWMCGEGYGWW